MIIEEIRHGTVMVLKLTGALVEDDLNDLATSVKDQLSAGASRLILDLSDVPFIDSAGLECLLETVEEAEKHGGGIKIACATEITRDILIATRLAGRIEGFADVALARKSFM